MKKKEKEIKLLAKYGAYKYNLLKKQQKNFIRKTLYQRRERRRRKEK